MKSCSLGMAAVVLALATLGAPAWAQQAGTNVAVIDISHIFKNHTRFKQMMEDVNADVKAFEAQVVAEQTRVKKMGEQLKTFNPESREFKELEEQMARAAGELQLQMGLKRKDFLEREAKIYHQIYNEIVQEVAWFSQQYNIGLVIRHSADPIDPARRDSVLQGVNRMVVYQNQLDITAQVLARLAPKTGDQRNGGGIPGRPNQ